MKKLVNFSVVLMTIALSLVITSCDKEENYEFSYPSDHFDYQSQYKYFAQFIEHGLPEKLPEGWYREEIHYDRDEGLRANSLEIYFVNEDGNSLINIDDYTTWPVSMSIDAAAMDPDNYYATCLYQHRQLAWVAISNGESLPHFDMMAPVDGEHTYSYKLHMLGNEYDMQITYLYESGATGGCCYPHIFRWDINGELLYSDFEDQHGVNDAGKSHQAIVTIKKDGTLSVQRIWIK